jgi:exoribonuclease R
MERNVAHRIIEEFMLLANETVAAHLVANDVPALHRVHEAPDLKKVETSRRSLRRSATASRRAATPSSRSTSRN